MKTGDDQDIDVGMLVYYYEEGKVQSQVVTEITDNHIFFSGDRNPIGMEPQLAFAQKENVKPT